VGLTLRTALALAVTLLIPSSASAATTIGSSMPTFAGDTVECLDSGGCTFVPTSIAGVPVVVPFKGVIVGWSAQVPAGGSAVDLKVLRPADGGTFTARSTATGTTPDASGRMTSTARVRVAAGELIGVDLANGEEIGIFGHSSFDSASLTFAPRLGTGGTRAPDFTDSDDYEMLFNAVIEPDADGDGYGDETQDKCPDLAETHLSPCTDAPVVTLTPTWPSGGLRPGERLKLNATVGGQRANHRLPQVTLRFTIPAGLQTVGTVSFAPCTVTPGQVVCQMGDITRTRSASVQLELLATRPGSSRLEATATTALRAVAPQSRSVPIQVLGLGRCELGEQAKASPFRGSVYGDRISGRAVADRLSGLAGDDCLLGLLGDDVLNGGAGNDSLEGGRGRDLLRGDGGADQLTGGPGNDRLEAGPGADVVAAVDKQRDVVRCGDGRDRARVDRIDSVAGCEKVTRVPPVKKKRPKR
jgi:RTX calcium-binding nonapeptide repeat (4 copies)